MPRFFCETCNVAIPTGKRRYRYCSNACAATRTRRALSPGYDENGYGALSKNAIGAAHELMVCADLVRRGFHVFRAVSPDTPCDIIALRSDCQTFRVEVKTAQRQPGGQPRPVTGKRLRTDQHDVLALVCHNGEITYRPELGVLQSSQEPPSARKEPE